MVITNAPTAHIRLQELGRAQMEYSSSSSQTPGVISIITIIEPNDNGPIEPVILATIQRGEF